MATTPSPGSGMYSNPPIGNYGCLGTTGPLDQAKFKSMVSQLPTKATNDFNGIRPPKLVKKK